MEPVKPPLLPVWTTVRASYALAWENRGEYFRMSWGWLVAVPVVYLLYGWMTIGFYAQYMSQLHAQLEALAQGERPDQNAFAVLQLKGFAIGLPLQIFAIFVGASIAVSWHRLILRNEKHAHGQYFRHDGLVQRYFVVALILAMMVIVPSLLGPAISVVTGHEVIGQLVMFVPMVVFLILSVRLTVLLPAKALELKHIDVKDVRARTRSNFWRMALGYLLCTLVLIPMDVLAIAASNYIGYVYMQHSLNFLLFSLFGLPFYLTFMSLAFKHFYPEEFAGG